MARQPVFTFDEKVFGYELLFRDGVEDYFREKDGDAASRKTLDSSLQMSLQMFCDGRRAFVNWRGPAQGLHYALALASSLWSRRLIQFRRLSAV